MSGICFKLECPRNLTTGATYAAETAYPYAGLKFIHGFNGVLTTLWYLKDLNTFTALMQF
jgi:hypothetical protein